MRWSQLLEKECVQLETGEKLGVFHRADLVIDPMSGKIETVVLPVGHSFFRRQTAELTFRWEAIQTIGPELILIQHRSYARE
jgi:YlmC/YmxH family sporulation protein